MKLLFKALTVIGSAISFSTAQFCQSTMSNNCWEQPSFITEVKTQLGTNNVQFTNNGRKHDACNVIWQFDGSTSQGKNLLTAILSAKGTGKKVSILSGSQVGTNGCQPLWSLTQFIVLQ